MESLGERVRRLREEHGLNLAEVASFCSCSEGTIRQIESGNVKSPSFRIGLRLADRFHVDPHYLLDGVEDQGLWSEVAAIKKRLDALEAEHG